MSFYIDHQFINMISPRLKLFKRKGDHVYNFRCPHCGDSKKNEYKARGYIFPYKGGLTFKCHNCGVSESLGTLLKFLDPEIYKEYQLERFKDGVDSGPVNRGHKFEYKEQKTKFEPPKKRLIDDLLDRVDKLDDDHMAVKYVKSRLIPEDKWNLLYHIDHIADIVQLSEKYKKRIKGKEPRMIIPFFDHKDQMFALTARAYDNHKLRYVDIRINESYPMIYGLERIDPKKPIIVVEGPLDSLFLDNAIAVGGTTFRSLEKYLPKSKLILVFDNQPKNKEVCKLQKQCIKYGYRTFIWPDRFPEKDINDNVLKGFDRYDIQEAILNSPDSGIENQMKFDEWCKIDTGE